MKRLRACLAPATLLALVCMLSALGAGSPALPMDEGQLLVYPERVLQGAVPNRDFEHTYGPGNLWVLALVYRFAGAGIGVERAVGLGYRLILVGLTYAVSRSWTSVRVAWCCGALCVLFLQPLAQGAFAWLAGLCFSIAALRVTQKALTDGARPRRCLGVGALAGGAILFRPDLALALAAMLLPLATAVRARARLSLLAGLAFGSSGLLAHVVMAGPAAAARGLLLEPWWAAAGRHLPLASRSLEDKTTMALLAAATAVLLIAALKNAGPAGWLPIARARASAAFFSVGLLAQAMQRADSWHIYCVACVSIPLAISLLPPLGIPRMARPLNVQVLLAGAALIFAPGAARVTLRLLFGSVAASSDVRLGDRRVPLAAEEDPAHLQLIVQLLATRHRSGQTLFVGPRDLRRTNNGDTFIYHLFPDLRPASYFTEMNPGVANRPGSRLADDLRRADWLLLTTRFDDWSEQNASSQPGPDDANRVVEEHFCLLERQGMYSLFASSSSARHGRCVGAGAAAWPAAAADAADSVVRGKGSPRARPAGAGASPSSPSLARR